MNKKDAMHINVAVDQLEALNGDPEIDHGKAEDILLNLIEKLTGTDTVTTAFRRAQVRVGFWYA